MTLKCQESGGKKEHFKKKVNIISIYALSINLIISQHKISNVNNFKSILSQYTTYCKTEDLFKNLKQFKYFHKQY